MNRKSASSYLFNGVNYLLLAVIGAAMMFPFLYVFTISFSTYKEFLQSEFMLFPKTWVTTAYEYILNSKPFVRSIGVTIEITVIGTLVNLLFTASLAYMLSRPVFAQRTIMFFVVFTLLFTAGMIPTYLVVKETGLINSIWSLILPAAISPYYLIVMRQFFLSIPSEITEAAVIDGANDLKVFWKIILPLSKPSLAAFGLFYAVAHWNNYFTGLLYLNNSADWPIQVVLRQIVVVGEPQASLEMATEFAPPAETIQMAAILLATVPILVLYPFLQKHFAKGVMLGSVKG
ncbi:carbohydrate ABC transporter permease [Paenibacillus sp. MBLB4367]|uniref:carbohydrate ABC transporter permease n=1 Tax=Paenibacillus sp. MBLB4367 TaxID=3384767 RepID=UPI003907F270